MTRPFLHDTRLSWGERLLTQEEVDGTAWWAGRRIYCPERKRALSFNDYTPACDPADAPRINAVLCTQGYASDLAQAKSIVEERSHVWKARAKAAREKAERGEE